MQTGTRISLTIRQVCRFERHVVSVCGTLEVWGDQYGGFHGHDQEQGFRETLIIVNVNWDDRKGIDHE